jgi:SnoaL-like domain
MTSEVIDGAPRRWHAASMTNPINQLVDTYIMEWNEGVPERRRALVAEVFTDEATYRDPMMSGDGADAIDAMIGAAQQQFPGHRFVLAGAPDAHHDQVRFVWHLEPAAGGDAVAVGHDFGTIAPDGRLASVVGFLEQPEAAAA